MYGWIETSELYQGPITVELWYTAGEAVFLEKVAS